MGRVLVGIFHYLAVFLGLVAENIRENNVERNREKEFIESVVKDVRADTANAGIVNRDFLYRQPYLDSIVENFTPCCMETLKLTLNIVV